MHFTFATAARIVFGPGTARDIPVLTQELGERACLITGGSPERSRWLVDELEAQGLSPLIIPIAGEPDTDTVVKAAGEVRRTKCDVIVATGGGSVLDAGKAVAALAANPGDVFDYLEVVGRGRPLAERPLPVVAVPTTAGTGAEVTANAVLISRQHGLKISLRSRSMLPAVAVVDPELALGLPPAVTAAAGMDALTQLQEAFVSSQGNPMTSALCREGLIRSASALPKAYADGRDADAREDMALAALLSGIALANAKLGAVHGLAAPLGGMFHAAHGALCGALLPHVMAMNIRLLRERTPDAPPLDAYTETARILTGNPEAEAEDGIAWVLELCARLDIAPLAALGVDPDEFPTAATTTARSSSMRGDPVELREAELLEILHAAL